MIDDGTAVVAGYSLFRKREKDLRTLSFWTTGERTESRTTDKSVGTSRLMALLPQPLLDIEFAQQGHLQEDGLQEGGLHPLDF